MAAKESFDINGENLLKKVKELIAEGNVTKIIITDKVGKELATFPLTIGVVGALLLPMLAAIGAIAALIGECTITVEREEAEKDLHSGQNPES
ncbi:MAG TPA: DUF4342 domain-containing protein [Mucilaginibacter sp.]